MAGTARDEFLAAVSEHVGAVRPELGLGGAEGPACLLGARGEVASSILANKRAAAAALAPADKRARGASPPPAQQQQQQGHARNPDAALELCSLMVVRRLRERGALVLTTAGAEIGDEALRAAGLELNAAARTEFLEKASRRVSDTTDVLVALDLAQRRGAGEAVELVPLGQEESAAPLGDLGALEREREAVLKSIVAKTAHLEALVRQAVALRALAERNKGAAPLPAAQRVPLPFIVLSTGKDTVIECEMAENQSDIFFNLNQPFELHDDGEVLRRLLPDAPKATRAELEGWLGPQVMPFVPKDLLRN
jgi:hypothetical protein